jgi:single-stranded-DNA-specific exonuclease
LALRKQLREIDWFSPNGIAEPNLAQLLDLVALGTVADVVPLSYTNRILVQQGLLRIRAGKCCEGASCIGRSGKKRIAAPWWLLILVLDWRRVSMQRAAG